MTSTGARAGAGDASQLSVRPFSPTDAARWGVPVRLGERRVLQPGRLLWLRAMALGFVGLLVACTAAVGCYVLAVRLGEGRRADELALRPALPGLVVGALLGLLMMAVLMGVMLVTALYDIALVGAAPAWAGLGLALQAAVTEELWMRALLFRLLWRAVGPVPAFAVAALVFGALHLANPGATALAGASVAVAGLMFCALYALTGRLWLPIGLHLAWNFAQGYLFGAAVSGARRRRLGHRQHRPPRRGGLADRRDVRTGGLGARTAPGHRDDPGRAVAGPPEWPFRRPTGPPRATQSTERLSVEGQRHPHPRFGSAVGARSTLPALAAMPRPGPRMPAMVALQG